MSDGNKLLLEERVLVLAPTAADAALSRSLLADAGMACQICIDLCALSRAYGEGAGAILVTEEALAASNSYCLVDVLHQQPAWSDVPILLLTSQGADSPVAVEAMERLGNVTLLERPVRLNTLVSALRMALRARRRQYELRKRIEQRRAAEERFRLAAEAVNGIIYEYDLQSGHAERTRGLFEVLGYRPDEVPPNAAWWREQVHPDDRPAVHPRFEESATAGSVVSSEYRVRHKDGRWLHIEDRAVLLKSAEGRPVKMVGCRVDVTARKEAEEELREANRRKDEFLAMLGHELRNPLAPLRSVMEILRRQKLDGPGLEQAYAMMDRQIGHLGRLVDDLLDIARITRGRIELRKEPVNLAEVVDAAVEMVSPTIEGRGHELSVALPRKALRVEGDATRLTQIIFNLLNNAAKYTDAGGRIWLTVEREGKQAVVGVRDNGTGMKAELVPKVFDLFIQGDRTLDRSQGGLGLGLTLVKHLVELHGGSVEARSEGPGKGSEFTVRFPALPPEAEKLPPAHAPGPPQVEVQLSRALVVDDNFDVAESVTWMLEGLAREIKMVHSGQAALDLVGQWRPDVIVCDIGMPGMDGYETCRRLRQVPGLEKAVIAAVSGYGGPEERRKSQTAGFDRHLVKPIGRATLVELVQSAAGA